MYKHYIQINDNKVTNLFSTAFQEPSETDICINQDAGRHAELFGIINPNLTENGIYKYKWDGKKVVERTQADKDIDIAIIEKDKQKQAILNELAQLDIEVPRIVEDLINHTEFKPFSSKKALIDRKIELRNMLKEM